LNKLFTLRRQDPNRWTLETLSDEFHIDLDHLKDVLRFNNNWCVTLDKITGNPQAHQTIISSSDTVTDYYVNPTTVPLTIRFNYSTLSFEEVKSKKDWAELFQFLEINRHPSHHEGLAVYLTRVSSHRYRICCIKMWQHESGGRTHDKNVFFPWTILSVCSKNKICNKI